MIDFFHKLINNKKVLILGFGKEGFSTYKFLKKYFPEQKLTIADRNPDLFKQNKYLTEDKHLEFMLGESYLEKIDDFDVVIKSPGISFKDLKDTINYKKITSQTDIFLQFYHKQIIGVTGTKGKSTTASLLKHILSSFFNDVILIGNIGKPAFEIIENISSGTKIIFELSSHQLEYISKSPHISILLNIFQEHLDHYKMFYDYQLAKFNITKFQDKDDYFIYNADDRNICELVEKFDFKRNYLRFSLSGKKEIGAFIIDEKIMFSNKNKSEEICESKIKRNLFGEHNLMNILSVITTCKILKIPNELIIEGILSFKGLKHRLEYVGEFSSIYFYNDSIATIPEATIHAIKTLKMVDTIILGGFDRGVNYENFIEFLSNSKVRNFIFIGDVGKRLLNGLRKKKAVGKKYFLINSFDEIIETVIKNTKPKTICLLSPAAASYDMFRNFEQRGNIFKNIVRNI